jgi:hypothetical protein
LRRPGLADSPVESYISFAGTMKSRREINASVGGQFQVRRSEKCPAMKRFSPLLRFFSFFNLTRARVFDNQHGLPECLTA